VWSCHRCNNLKRDEWPARGTSASHAGGEGFIDRFREDNASDFFEVKDDGRIVARKPPAQYIIDRLKLDRAGLVRQRRVRINAAATIEFLVSHLVNLDEMLASCTSPDVVQTIEKMRSEFIRSLESHRSDWECLFHSARSR